MEIKITIKQTLTVLLILSWIIFVGLCIEAGAFIVNAILAMVNPKVVSYMYHQIDLSGLYNYDHGDFFVVTFIMSIAAALKAWLFFLIIKRLSDKDVNIAQPFSKKVGQLIFRLSYVALMISFFCWYGSGYTGWLVRQGVKMPDTQALQLDGGDVWFLMAIVLFVIAQIFKKGIEIQRENELTI